MRRTGGILAITVAAGAITVQVWAGSQGQPGPSQAVQRFVGTWRLVTATTSGKPNPNRGARPIGVIYYDATGQMAVQIAPERARPSWPTNSLPTPEQAKDAVTGYTAYFGTYTVDEKAGTVTHHRQAALNMYAVDLVRRYEFTPEGQLVLVPVDNPVNRLVWQRIR